MSMDQTPAGRTIRQDERINGRRLSSESARGCVIASFDPAVELRFDRSRAMAFDHKTDTMHPIDEGRIGRLALPYREYNDALVYWSSSNIPEYVDREYRPNPVAGAGFRPGSCVNETTLIRRGEDRARSAGLLRLIVITDFEGADARDQRIMIKSAEIEGYARIFSLRELAGHYDDTGGRFSESAWRMMKALIRGRRLDFSDDPLLRLGTHRSDVLPACEHIGYAKASDPRPDRMDGLMDAGDSFASFVMQNREALVPIATRIMEFQDGPLHRLRHALSLRKQYADALEEAGKEMGARLTAPSGKELESAFWGLCDERLGDINIQLMRMHERMMEGHPEVARILEIATDGSRDPGYMGYERHLEI